MYYHVLGSNFDQGISSPGGSLTIPSRSVSGECLSLQWILWQLKKYGVYDKVLYECTSRCCICEDYFYMAPRHLSWSSVRKLIQAYLQLILSGSCTRKPTYLDIKRITRYICWLDDDFIRPIREVPDLYHCSAPSIVFLLLLGIQQGFHRRLHQSCLSYFNAAPSKDFYIFPFWIERIVVRPWGVGQGGWHKSTTAESLMTRNADSQEELYWLNSHGTLATGNCIVRIWRYRACWLWQCLRRSICFIYNDQQTSKLPRDLVHTGSRSRCRDPDQDANPKLVYASGHEAGSFSYIVGI